MIFITLFLIPGITGLVWLINKFLPFRVCPVCAGVTGTWMLLFLARLAGFPIDNTILALLMGGTAVGIAYRHPSLLFKTIAISLGFVIGYGIVTNQLVMAGITILAYLIFAGLFFLKNSPVKKETKASVEIFKKQMENCC